MRSKSLPPRPDRPSVPYDNAFFLLNYRLLEGFGRAKERAVSCDTWYHLKLEIIHVDFSIFRKN